MGSSTSFSIVTDFTVGQAATVINAGIAVVHFTIGLSIPIIIFFFLRNANTALTWSHVARTLHSSFLTTLLSADSTSGSGGSRISRISTFTILFTILVPLSAVVTPLGLKEGIISQSTSQPMHGSFVKDTSPLGLATSPRDKYTYGRLCGRDTKQTPCPGTDSGSKNLTSQIGASTFDIFTSTSQGPFNMQFRRYYPGFANTNSSTTYAMTLGTITVAQSVNLRNDIFAVHGLIVDMTTNPGVGLRNHTLPSLALGGKWSEEILWMEPSVSCVSNNLTVVYQVPQVPFLSGLQNFNLTDQGGFVNLTSERFDLFSDHSQDIDLFVRAYTGAVLSNHYLMKSFNLTQNESYIGKAIPLNTTLEGRLGEVQIADVSEFVSQIYSSNTNSSEDRALVPGIACEGYGSGDIANITNVAVHCFMFLGPPQRIDGGDQMMLEANSRWSQSLHVCASATRIRMQNVTFNFNGTTDLSYLEISRKNTNTSVLWGVEKTNTTIRDIDLFWGRISDIYEDNPLVSTVRQEYFYIPAGLSDIMGFMAPGQPTTIPAAAWNLFGPFATLVPYDYSGGTSFALLNKWQSAIAEDPENGAANIMKWIWTDLVANNLVGNDTSTTLLVAKNESALIYSYPYGVFLVLLVLLWLPIFLLAIIMLITGVVRLSHLEYLLNQTSVGRLVTGDSSLRVLDCDYSSRASGGMVTSPLLTPRTSSLVGNKMGQPTRPDSLSSSQWAYSSGKILVGFPIREMADNDRDIALEHMELSPQSEDYGESQFINADAAVEAYARRRSARGVIKDLLK